MIMVELRGANITRHEPKGKKTTENEVSFAANVDPREPSKRFQVWAGQRDRDVEIVNEERMAAPMLV